MQVYLIKHEDGLWKTGKALKRDFINRAKIYPTLGLAKNALSNMIYTSPSKEDQWTIYEFEITETPRMFYKSGGRWKESWYGKSK